MVKIDWDLIDTLQKIAKNFQPQLQKKVKNGLKELGAGRELKLLNHIFKHYYQKKGLGRWYDPYHVLLSTGFAIQLVKIDKRVSSLIVPAIILHEVGYCALGNDQDWRTIHSRITHMQEGAAISAKILASLGDYNPKEIGIIIGMIATHDNGYLGIPEKDPQRLSLRDADTIFVMSFISFYKDWFSIMAKQESFSLSDLLTARQTSFYNKPSPNFSGSKGSMAKEDKSSSSSSPRLPNNGGQGSIIEQRRHLPQAAMAKQWMARQFEVRQKEIQDNIIKDKDTFWQYAVRYIRDEIESGRG
ncbi:MAG: hypothetical protein Q7K28_03635 [Candidatus Wildermuthbacteria bacterium]|nr:hypothetical protein [Candidatus Wildermuthbacteria bacterium]